MSQLVSHEELMYIHTVMVKRYPASGLGIRDQNAIESALARPLTSFEGTVLYDTPFLRAAVLWHGLLKNHGFVDANKRTSTEAMRRWLDREGFWLRADDAQVVTKAIEIANDRITVQELAAWLDQHSESHSEASE